MSNIQSQRWLLSRRRFLRSPGLGLKHGQHRDYNKPHLKEDYTLSDEVDSPGLVSEIV